MKKFLLTGMLVLFVVATVSIVSYAQPRQRKMQNKKAGPHASIRLQITMRKLWEDHITYTRNYIISAVADLDDASEVTQRLLRNQDELGDAIKPIYGEEAGKRLAVLLRDHIMITTEFVRAKKMGKSEEIEKANRKWYASADDIAVFLKSINPNWSREDLEDMLHKHLEFTNHQIMARIKKDWVADIDAYDKDHEHMLMFADTLADGMAPGKFNE